MALEAGQKMDKEPPVDLTFAASGLHPSDSAGGLLELHNKRSHVTDFQIYHQYIKKSYACVLGLSVMQRQRQHEGEMWHLVRRLTLTCTRRR